MGKLFFKEKGIVFLFFLFFLRYINSVEIKIENKEWYLILKNNNFKKNCIFLYRISFINDIDKTRVEIPYGRNYYKINSSISDKIVLKYKLKFPLPSGKYEWKVIIFPKNKLICKKIFYYKEFLSYRKEIREESLIFSNICKDIRKIIKLLDKFLKDKNNFLDILKYFKNIKRNFASLKKEYYTIFHQHKIYMTLCSNLNILEHILKKFILYFNKGFKLKKIDLIKYKNKLKKILFSLKNIKRRLLVPNNYNEKILKKDLLRINEIYKEIIAKYKRYKRNFNKKEWDIFFNNKKTEISFFKIIAKDYDKSKLSIKYSFMKKDFKILINTLETLLKKYNYILYKNNNLKIKYKILEKEKKLKRVLQEKFKNLYNIVISYEQNKLKNIMFLKDKCEYYLKKVISLKKNIFEFLNSEKKDIKKLKKELILLNEDIKQDIYNKNAKLYYDFRYILSKLNKILYLYDLLKKENNFSNIQLEKLNLKIEKYKLKIEIILEKLKNKIDKVRIK